MTDVLCALGVFTSSGQQILTLFNLCGVAITAVLPLLRCCHHCGVATTAVWPSLRCCYHCGVVITAVLPSLGCCHHCGVAITAVLPQLQCFHHCGVATTAVLPLLRCCHNCDVAIAAMLPPLRCCATDLAQQMIYNKYFATTAAVDKIFLSKFPVSRIQAYSNSCLVFLLRRRRNLAETHRSHSDHSLSYTSQASYHSPYIDPNRLTFEHRNHRIFGLGDSATEVHRFCLGRQHCIVLHRHFLWYWYT